MTVSFGDLSMSFAATADGEMTLVFPDNFAERESLVLLPQEVVLPTLADATMETGENATTALFTKTLWYQIDVTSDPPEKLHLQVTGGVGVVQVALYRASAAVNLSGAEPVFADLTLMGVAADLRVTLDESHLRYYAQVGLVSGAGTGWTLFVEDSDPPDGGTFATAIAEYDAWGSSQVDTGNAPPEASEPTLVGVTTVGSAWVAWTCPTPAPTQVTVSVTADGTQTGDWGVGVYTGAALGALTLVGSDPQTAIDDSATVTFAPTAGVTYRILVVTEDDRHLWDVAWTSAGALSDPASPIDGMRAEVYERDGTTLITEIPRRRGVNFTEPLNTPGFGEMSIHSEDPMLAAYPTMLKVGNIVKFWLGATCVHGFRIKTPRSTYVSAGEHSERWRTVSGPSVHHMLGDFVVHHDGDVREDSLDTRSYSWASKPADWYDPNDWNDYTNASTQTNPPGDWWKPANQRKKYGKPKKWPDPNSKWLWFNGGIGHRWNDADRRPKRRIWGKRYYRREFKIKEDQTHVRLFVTADEKVTVFIDGELVIEKIAVETGYRTFGRVDTVLSRGTHTVAIHTKRLRKTGDGDGTDAMMFSMFSVKADGKRDEVLVRSDTRFRCYYGDGVPGWRRAQVLRSSIFEARARGNTTADRLSFGFDGDIDSAGNPWTDRFSQDVRIGTSSLDLQAQLSEGNGFDVWVDPRNLRVHAWRRRGIDRSHSVALIPGVNLLDWEVEENDEIGNVFFVQYDGGWVTVKAPGSIRANDEREVYIELGGFKDEGTVKDVMKQVIRGVESAIVRAGSPDIKTKVEKGRDGSLVAVPGAVPFLDFGVGDIVSAPRENGDLVRFRVLSLSCTEDENGDLSFDPELEQV